MTSCAPYGPYERLTTHDQYLTGLGLDALELEELLTAIDKRMEDGTRETRALLAPCRNAVVRELQAALTPR